MILEFYTIFIAKGGCGFETLRLNGDNALPFG